MYKFAKEDISNKRINTTAGILVNSAKKVRFGWSPGLLYCRYDIMACNALPITTTSGIRH